MNAQRFNRYTELDEIPGEVEFFLTHGEERKVARGEFFLRQGQKSDYIGYVAEGGFRHLVESSDGTEHVAGYSFMGDFVTAYPAFGSPFSAVSFQAYKNSTLFLVPKEEVFARQSWEFRWKVADLSLSDVYGRLLLVHVGTPEERYRSLIGHYPAILNEVPLKEIASFLGVTPETLSRIRKKMLQKENY